MKFTFEEVELINNFLVTIDSKNISKEFLINSINDAKNNTEESELIAIAENVVKKFKSLDDRTIKNIFNNLPISIFDEI